MATVLNQRDKYPAIAEGAKEPAVTIHSFLKKTSAVFIFEMSRLLQRSRSVVLYCVSMPSLQAPAAAYILND